MAANFLMEMPMQGWIITAALLVFSVPSVAAERATSFALSDLSRCAGLYRATMEHSPKDSLAGGLAAHRFLQFYLLAVDTAGADAEDDLTLDGVEAQIASETDRIRRAVQTADPEDDRLYADCDAMREAHGPLFRELSARIDKLAA